MLVTATVRGPGKQISHMHLRILSTAEDRT